VDLDLTFEGPADGDRSFRRLVTLEAVAIDSERDLVLTVVDATERVRLEAVELRPFFFAV
jgi:hypothetical protein